MGFQMPCRVNKLVRFVFYLYAQSMTLLGGVPVRVLILVAVVQLGRMHQEAGRRAPHETTSVAGARANIDNEYYKT